MVADFIKQSVAQPARQFCPTTPNFKVLSLFLSLEIDCFTVKEHGNICTRGLNRQAGYAAGNNNDRCF